MSFSFGLPDASLWALPKFDTQVPPSPFQCEKLTKIFAASMKVSTPLTIAIVYFTSVHFINPIVVRRQLKKANVSQKDGAKLTEKEMKRLKPAPYKIATYGMFKLFVLLHNIFLCAYSVWTFVGMLNSFSRTVSQIQLKTNTDSTLVNFVHAVCDLENGIFQQTTEDHNLALFGWWFYISKFYEVIDTIIILLKGRPSSLLQSYHHAGAMMCMWSGIRYQSPPIWIFVVFNSFIHSLMYFYFTLACLKIRVPTIVKRALTSMQISQFVLGGSLAVFHAFIWYSDVTGLEPSGCINTSAKALPLLINVAYLTPLTALFAAFYIESYIKRKTA
ncbi:hypothetical protein METBIDRAFT_33562 [Metschnikowia bicuspidata var. bicuspidata NRRL YB-4993]|uniref:Elongation of fatty acids protein n=1 Tax=Metschnikowia bicuspidata var. bicuspidata NRRL YB-4993 TaxID=869754 RepID=A0A1A0H663_9ASCO|nr:hypothetical protein METBIDRAFT_33562 [Metschnikowia bicuspidata var. bicuspidata NRRL YB-4993]OBA19397.1 hypothetical protein METBIDRAFT_33562 [Metschnikowia bicuspidata var. bicuspidata NRRL YB-4993]